MVAYNRPVGTGAAADKQVSAVTNEQPTQPSKAKNLSLHLVNDLAVVYLAQIAEGPEPINRFITSSISIPQAFLTTVSS